MSLLPSSPGSLVASPLSSIGVPDPTSLLFLVVSLLRELRAPVDILECTLLPAAHRYAIRLHGPRETSQAVLLPRRPLERALGDQVASNRPPPSRPAEGVPGAPPVQAPPPRPARLERILPSPVPPGPPKADAPAGTGAPSLLAPPAISSEALEQAGMVLARNARSRISEEYRIVIGRVLRALKADSPGNGAQNVVMVTSARPGEGKSFSALNLAGSIAQHGNDKVLLVDLDAKLRPVSALLGVNDRIGFQDLVTNPSLRPEDLILQTALDNLSVLPVGTRMSGGVDANATRPIPPTVTRLARRFPKHVIVLDAPPCLSTSDPHTIAPYVGQVVMVVEAERTQRSELEAAIDLVRVCPTITILLNKVRLTTSYTFGAYDYYGSYT